MTKALLDQTTARLDAWEAGFGPVAPHPASAVDAERLGVALDEFLDRLTAPPRGPSPGMYPFFHPRFVGQMLKPPHPVALAAYAAAARINPNNHALDGGPPTAAMEREAVSWLAEMLGFPETHLGHLTGGGTVANLEALFVAREETNGRAVAVSRDAHYTHARMNGVLGVETVLVECDDDGRMRLDALEEALASGRVGTVVLTAATTGLGTVDPIAEAIPLCRSHGARVHIDAAYGGFFRLLTGADAPHGFPAADFQAIGDADSVVVDPHKHGLQPYGCGAVLFRDPSVGRHYRHDSPYTYFTSEALHLGEISLECSRPGAAAAALWLTLRALPLRADDGLGPILTAGLRAARDLAARLDASDRFRVWAPPTTDIVVYAPKTDAVSTTDAAAGAIFDAGTADPADPLFLSLYRLDAARLGRRWGLAPDAPSARVLRSVLMKPEHEPAVPWIASRLDRLADDL
ncbi:MAG TPA: aminotransferase class V-fold PLP-dependent enzyme [Rubricoccaceae bacterium]|jgi:glutamate/tyrosine decarboxylase-like PLP-dependent enzyme